jgi:hypothetical protein
MIEIYATAMEHLLSYPARFFFLQKKNTIEELTKTSTEKKYMEVMRENLTLKQFEYDIHQG